MTKKGIYYDEPKVRRIYYTNIQKDEKEIVSKVLDDNKVKVFYGCKSWYLRKDELGYWIDRTFWENPVRKDNLEQIAEFLNDFYKK